MKKNFPFYIIIFSLVIAIPASPADAALQEYEVKAAFLYQFTKFVEWPEDQKMGSDFNLCVYGRNPFGDVLAQLEGESVGNQKVNVKKVRDLAVVNACRVLFISSSEEEKIPEILNSLGNTHVLTVSEVNGFLQKGGIINFIRQGKKIRFEINQKVANKTGIKISSKLLSLASNVITP